MPKTSMRFLDLGAIAILAAAWVSPAAAGAVANVVRGAAETKRDAHAGAGISDCAGLRRVITLKFFIGQDGYLQGPIDTDGLDIRTDVDAHRAVNAVRRAEPYAATYRGLRMIVRFKARTACAEHN
jgi:hypothetical protein